MRKFCFILVLILAFSSIVSSIEVSGHISEDTIWSPINNPYIVVDNKLYESEEPTTEEIISTNIISSNYPNPFNPTTTIEFSLPVESDIKLTVYNVRGQRVKQLVSEEMAAGQHTVVWNGTDKSNKSVASGLYFYKLTSDDETVMRKMLLLK